MGNRGILGAFMGPQLMFYLPPLAGIGTYLLVIYLFDGATAEPLAWVNMVAGASSLVMTTILFTPDSSRRHVLDRFLGPGTFVTCLAGVALVYATGHAAGIWTFMIALALLYRSLCAVSANDEMRTLQISFISSIALPLSSLLTLIESQLIELVSGALALAGTLLVTGRFGKRVGDAVPVQHANSELCLNVIGASFLAQAALFLYPFLELRVIRLSTAQEYTGFLAHWKIIYGASVLLYARVQFRLAFGAPSVNALRRHIVAAGGSFVATVILSIADIKVLLPATIFFTCVFINAVAVIVRAGLRQQPTIGRAWWAFGSFIGVVAFVYSQLFSDLLSWLGRSGTDVYPVVLCIVLATTLLSLPSRRMATILKYSNLS